MNGYTIRPYTPHNWSHIVPLLDVCSFRQTTGHAERQSGNDKKLTCERLQNALGSPDHIAWMALQENAVQGFAVFSKLRWDSEQLGMSAARLEYLVATGSYREQHQIKECLINKVLDETLALGVWHLSARVDSFDLSGLHVLEEAGFITVDNILTFTKDLAKHESSVPAHDFQIRLATPDDAEGAADLARHAYTYDRFHADPFIKSENADELHAVWLMNSCNGTAADAVIVAEDAGGLLGFVTCKLQSDTGTHSGRMIGTIVLVATAERARGMGIGYATTMAALEWFREQGAAVVEVGTQLSNIPASHLYQKCGFALAGSSVSLRKLL